MLSKYEDKATKWLAEKVRDWEARRGGDETEEDDELAMGHTSMRAPSSTAATFGPALGDAGRGVAINV